VTIRLLPGLQTRKEEHMDDRETKISGILHEAAETHHIVFRITDGEDPDWATWYSEWLLRLSDLPSLLGAPPVRSELTWKLVGLDREYTSEPRAERWEDHYARELVAYFGGSA
jgi:hypothetical protein